MQKSAKYVIFLPHSRHITGILYAMNSSSCHNIEFQHGLEPKTKQ